MKHIGALATAAIVCIAQFPLAKRVKLLLVWHDGLMDRQTCGQNALKVYRCQKIKFEDDVVNSKVVR